MAKKRQGKYEYDIERLAERIWRESQGRITDWETYNYQYDQYLDFEHTDKQDEELRKQTFDAICARHPKVNPVKRFKKEQDQRRYETVKKQSEYTYIGTVRGKIAYAKQFTLVRKWPDGRTRIITQYRDTKGRFVRIVGVTPGNKMPSVTKIKG